MWITTLKLNEEIEVGGAVIKVLDTGVHSVRLGVKAPPEIKIIDERQMRRRKQQEESNTCGTHISK